LGRLCLPPAPPLPSEGRRPPPSRPAQPPAPEQQEKRKNMRNRSYDASRDQTDAETHALYDPPASSRLRTYCVITHDADSRKLQFPRPLETAGAASRRSRGARPRRMLSGARPRSSACVLRGCLGDGRGVQCDAVGCCKKTLYPRLSLQVP
jgi:hypothetical protein